MANAGTGKVVWGYGILAILVVAEISIYVVQNRTIVEHVVPIDTSRDRTLRISMNISFPAIRCEDANVHVMDESGKIRLDVSDSLVKRRLRFDGSPLPLSDMGILAERAAKEEDRLKKMQIREELQQKALWPDYNVYCGHCSGGLSDLVMACCQECASIAADHARQRDVVLLSRIRSLKFVCTRHPKGEAGSESGEEEEAVQRDEDERGCNLSGYLEVGSRAAGNFHVAMGRPQYSSDGRHRHEFNFEDAPSFNTSHTIHHLSFGPTYSSTGRWGTTTLDGVEKTTTKKNGMTGYFLYKIKVIPTIYKGRVLVKSVLRSSSNSGATVRPPSTGFDDGEEILETNRYVFTEVYRPLVTDKGERENLLPGVFFSYDLYPIALEFTRADVPRSHMLVWIVTTVGGVMTVMGWMRPSLSTRATSKRRVNMRLRPRNYRQSYRRSKKCGNDPVPGRTMHMKMPTV